MNTYEIDKNYLNQILDNYSQSRYYGVDYDVDLFLIKNLTLINGL